MRKHHFPFFALASAILLACIFAAPARATDDSYSYARIVRLSFVTGDVQILRPGASSNWEPAFANMPIQQGFTIGTGNGIAEIEFEQGTAVWVSRDSVLQFTELALSDGGRITKMTLAQGQASFQAGVKAGDTFEVSTPQFQVAPAGRAVFRIEDFSGGTGGSVSDFSGRLSISSSAGAQNLSQGQTLTFNGNASAKLTISNNAPRDAWDRWVSTRENYLVNGDLATQQNSSSPNSYGSADLSAYGSWNTIAGCGSGWQPYGVRAGWMPFLDGQWMMYPGLGWTWVSFEPWGWMPYHFGGWTNCGGAGWLWTPGENYFWNPGYVQWVGNGGNLGWRPLSPRHPRVNPPHPAAMPVVVATKNLTREGRYEVKTSSKVASSFHELSGPPLSDGKMPAPGSSSADRGSATRGGGQVLVSTAASLNALRAALGESVLPSPVGRAIGSGASRAPGATPAPIMLPARALVNAAPPPAKIPSPPPARAYAFAPSQPGQASARPSGSSESGRGWGGASSSSSASSSSRSESWGASRGASAPSSAPASAPSSSSSSSSGGGSHPH
jgi:hypothetical protein